MSRRRKPLVPEAKEALSILKEKVIEENKKSYSEEIAQEKRDYGQITAREAGKIGGPIGGSMVKELIRMAQEQLKEK